MGYVVGTHDGIDMIDERHELTLFIDAQYRAASAAAGLAAEVVERPMGPDRDRYVATGP
jgi:hypothetical protein